MKRKRVRRPGAWDNWHDVARVMVPAILISVGIVALLYLAWWLGTHVGAWIWRDLNG